MNARQTIPAWILRQANRRAARYGDDRVVRWIALPVGRRRVDPPPAHGASSNDNVVFLPRTSSSGT